MKKILYSIKDVKTGWLEPFTADSEKTILVTLDRAVNDLKIPYFEDKELYMLGGFDDETGELLGSDGNKFVIALKDLKKRERSGSDEV